MTLYKRDVIRPLHKARLLEHDTEADLIYISPLGVKQVEKQLLGRGAAG